MLAIFTGSVVKAPEELIQAASRSPTPKEASSKLVDAFVRCSPSSVSLSIGSQAHMLYSCDTKNSAQPRSFAAKDEIFCLFEGALRNLGSLKQHYGLGKNTDEAVLVMEAYRTLRDRAPYRANHMLVHLDGDFAFVIFDNATSTVFVASDQDGKVPMFMGVTADGYLAFSDDAEILKGACGKSLASFPPGCFLSTSTGLTSYENPKNRVTAIPAKEEEEMWGATFKIEPPNLQATPN
ncbi:uncharacterized protein M6B38_318080 [Iris pallida]|uniref:Glutamine amidotransferase type-2 domain-containing protein n=1 Tax=Iris pallida TaxID=29817 RepID=A0AAX6HDU5_IRIPA|nr:uncharacterized protein M6B38_318080 [Iris pallida]